MVVFLVYGRGIRPNAAKGGDGNKSKEVTQKEVESSRGHLPIPRGAKFMGAIFEKYPEVQSVTWDQYEDLGGYFSMCC